MSKLFSFLYLFENNEKKKFYILFFIVFIVSLVDLMTIGAILPLLIFLTDTKESSNHFVDSIIQNLFIFKNDNLIFFGFLILLFFFIIKTILVFFLIYYKNNIFKFFYISLSNKLVKAYMHSDYSKFISINSSKMINSINKEVELLVNTVINPLVILLLETLTTILILAFAFYISHNLFFITILFVFFSIIFFHTIFGKKLKKLGANRLENQQLIQQNLIQGFHGIKDIKLLNREFYFANIIADKISIVANLTRSYNFFSEIPRYLLEIFIIFLLGIFIFYLHFFEKSSLLISLSFFGAIAIRLVPSLNRISISINSIKYYSSITKNFINDLNYFDNDQNKKTNNIFDDTFKFKKIEFKNINYFYEKKQNILENFNFTIFKNDFIGIYGDSGSGKTTFVDIFSSLIEPTSGSIVINEDLKFDQNTIFLWRKIIGYVPQFPYFIEGSIYSNVALGVQDQNINYKAINHLIKEIKLSNYIDSLPNGANTIISDRGLNLSGGQKQKIAIIRALYKNPQILIFDESTSSLDETAEDEIINFINQIKFDKTIILISHKLNLFKNCSKVFEIKDKRIEQINMVKTK